MKKTDNLSLEIENDNETFQDMDYYFKPVNLHEKSICICNISDFA